MGENIFVKVYSLEPKDGLKDELVTALRALANSLTAMDDCLDCNLLMEAGTSETVCFIERWRNEDQYRAASRQIDRALFAPLGLLLADKPHIREFNELAF